MKRINDELLNKYVDHELTETELNELKDILEYNPDARTKLKAHELVDEILHKMEVNQAPQNFTEKIMDKINFSAIKKGKVSYFFVSVISIFVLAIISVIAFAIIKLGGEKLTSQKANPLIDRAKETLAENLNLLGSFVNNENIIFIGGALTVVLLISGYFMIESHKNFKDKLNRFSH